MGLRELERKVDKLFDAVDRLAHPTGGRRAEVRERWASLLAEMSDEELDELEQHARAALEDRKSRENREALQRTLNRLFGVRLRAKD